MSKFRGVKFFDNLKPLAHAIGGAIADNVMERDKDGKLPIGTRHDLSAPSLDDRLEKMEAKRFRRAAAARKAGLL